MVEPANGGPYPCCLHCRHSRRYEGHHMACDDCAAGLDVEPVLPVSTYARGAELGCPDCITGERHCCPFLWADAQPEPQRTRWLNHARLHLADVIAEVSHG